MNSPVDPIPMMEDMFGQPTLLPELLKLAARRRLARKLRAGGAIAAATALLVCAWLWNNPADGSSEKGALHLVATRTAACPIVPTAQFRAIVRTRPLAAADYAAAGPPVDRVQTRPGSGAYRLLDDRELLALVGARAAVLVRLAPHEQQLVFPERRDAPSFRAN